MGMKIIRNAIQCLKCGDVIESKHVSDLQKCRCGCCSVTGGLEVLSRTQQIMMEGDRNYFEMGEWA